MRCRPQRPGRSFFLSDSGLQKEAAVRSHLLFRTYYRKAFILIFKGQLSTAVKYSEEVLIAELKTKSRKAFDYLYDNYSPALYGVIKNIVKDEQTANDVLQEVFIKIWNGISSYEPTRARLYTWMINIARNLAIDKLRSANTLSRKENNDFIRKETESSKHVPFVEGIGLRKLIEELDEEQKQIIDLLYYRGYTQSEAAETLNIPLGTVKSRVRLAMVKLRKFF